MKILDVSMKGNAIRLYLGKDSTDISKITGDDWNDVVKMRWYIKNS